MPISTSLLEIRSSLNKFNTDENEGEEVWLHPAFCSVSPVEFAIAKVRMGRIVTSFTKPIIFLRLGVKGPYQDSTFEVGHNGLPTPKTFKINEELPGSGVKLIEHGPPYDEVSFFIDFAKSQDAYIKFGEKDVLLTDSEKKAILDVLNFWQENQDLFKID